MLKTKPLPKPKKPFYQLSVEDRAKRMEELLNQNNTSITTVQERRKALLKIRGNYI
jgi:hypothetical protein